MSKYYDLDKLKELIEAKAETLIGDGAIAFHAVGKWLDFLPAADVAAVQQSIDDVRNLPAVPKQRTGHWVEIDEEPHETWECGLCGFVIDAGSWRNPEACRDSYKYCPNCGAKMEGESNETAD